MDMEGRFVDCNSAISSFKPFLRLYSRISRKEKNAEKIYPEHTMAPYARNSQLIISVIWLMYRFSTGSP